MWSQTDGGSNHALPRQARRHQVDGRVRLACPSRRPWCWHGRLGGRSCPSDRASGGEAGRCRDAGELEKISSCHVNPWIGASGSKGELPLVQ